MESGASKSPPSRALRQPAATPAPRLRGRLIRLICLTGLLGALTAPPALLAQQSDDIDLVSTPTTALEYVLDIHAGYQSVQRFSTGPNAGGYVLSQVGLWLARVDRGGIPLVTIHQQDRLGPPGALLYTLTNPATLMDSLTSGEPNIFSAPENSVLLPDTDYSVRVSAPSTSSADRFVMAKTLSADQEGAEGWSVSDSGSRYASTDGGTTWELGPGVQSMRLRGRLNEIDESAVTADDVRLSTSGAYYTDDVIEATVTFSEAVDVTGTPTLALQIGGNSRLAAYASGNGSSELVFHYTVLADDRGVDGVSVATNALAAPAGASIAKQGTNTNAVLNVLPGLRNQTGHKVNTGPLIVSPGGIRITSTPTATEDTYGLGETIEITVTFDEPAIVDTAGGTPTIPLHVGSESRTADYVRGSGSATLVFAYVVQSGDQASHGVIVEENSLRRNSGTIRSETGLDAVVRHKRVWGAGHKVDARLTRVPVLSDLTLSPGTLDPGFAADHLTYTAEVGADVEVTTVTADAPSDVTVSIAPSDADGNVTGHQVALAEGDNSITVTSSRSGVSDVVYGVTVERASFGVGSVTAEEDTPYTFAVQDFNFVDSDAYDALASIKVVTLPTSGGLTLDGTAMAADQVVAVDDIGTLAFTPEANDNGQDYASFTFRVIDGDSVESVSVYTMNVDVTPVNDTPTGLPTISGEAMDGRTLTAATAGISDVDGLTGVAYEYQWVRVDDDGTSNATDIAGETADTYTLESADIGKKIQVRVRFSDEAATAETLTSDAYPLAGTIMERTGGICGRTEQVITAILADINLANHCADARPGRIALITQLNLSGQEISALADGDFAGLSGLRTLHLDNNELSSLPEGIFAGLSQLRTLNLNNNGLSSLPEGIFAGRRQLLTLNLNNNGLSSLPEGIFAGRSQLRFLILNGNPLSSLPEGIFAGLSELHTLDLVNINRLSSLPEGIFAGLSQLVILRLHHNNGLSSLPQGIFAGLSMLRDLKLQNNRIAALPADMFADLGELETLLLENNLLQSFPAGVFEPLGRLTKLELEGNPGAPFVSTAVALPDDGTISSDGGTVTLDGSGSGGPWGTNVTYEWALTDPTSGVTVTYDDHTNAEPQVTIEALDADTRLTFTLTVNGRAGTALAGSVSDTDTATVTAIDTSGDATLSGLTVNDGTSDRTLAPSFAPGTFVYTAAVENTVEDVTLTATVAQNGTWVSAVTLGGSAIADSDFTDGITIPSLVVGANVIVVTVTAQDTVTTEAYTLTVTRAVDGAPTASDGSVTTNEDTAHTFAAQEFNFAGNDPGDALASVTVVTLPAAGELALDGTAVTAGQVIGVADIGTLAFTPEANANGTDYASFTFRVSDGAAESAPAYTMTVNVTPVNDTPTGEAAISGTAETGRRLTAVTTGIADADGLTGVIYEYQWIRVDDDGASNATDIAGKIRDNYILTTADLGKKIKVRVRFTDEGGAGEELTSEAYPASGTVEVGGGICGRTPGVRDALVAVVQGITDCADVTDTHLANITASLRMQDGAVTAVTAGDFAGLTSLRDLRLDGNELSTLPVGVFAGLSSLNVLYLSGNALTTLPVEVFEGLSSLDTLRLDGNALTTLPVGVFGGLSSLSTLRLEGNELTTLPVGVFGGLSSLSTLHLEGNELTTLPVGVFGGLSSLRTLYLESNALSTLPAGVFSELSRLRTLYLHDNELQNLPEGVFEPLTKLTTLDLLDNPGAPFAPTAAALPDDGTVSSAGDRVTLDGSGSGGAWGTNVTYRWRLTDPAGVTVSFDDDRSAKPVVTIGELEVGTELTFTLTVRGRGGRQGIDPDTDTATVTAIDTFGDATLSGLTLSDGEGAAVALDQTFVSDLLTYTAEVGGAVGEITLAPVSSDPGASVEYLDAGNNAIADADSGRAGHQVLLAPGMNTIQVRVTAGDSAATRTYTVTVTRAPQAVTVEANHLGIGAGVEELEFTLTRVGSTAGALDVTVDISQEQEWLSDLSHTVTFGAGEATATLAFAASEVSLGPETSGALTATASGTWVSGGEATVRVVSLAHPPITIAFDQDAYTFAERAPAADVNIYVVATLDPAYPRAVPVSGIWVSLTTDSDTARSPEDFGVISGQVRLGTGDIESGTRQVARGLFSDGGQKFAIVDDDAYEGDEKLHVVVAFTPGNESGLVRYRYVDGSFCEVGCSSIPYPVTITDEGDRPVLSLSAAPASISEADDGTAPDAGNVSTLTVSIDNAKTFAADQAVTLTFAGPAPGADYTVSPADADGAAGHQVTLPAGNASVAVTVTAVDNTDRDRDRTVEVSGSLDGVNFGVTRTIVIVDDEPNTAPTGADTTVTTLEDVAYAFAAAEFGFSDANSGDTLASVTVVTLPSAGELALDGAAVTEDQAIAVADIGKLAFTPAPNGNGTDYAGFTFRVSDGMDESLSAYTMTVNVTPVQDAPAGAPAISGTAVVGGSLTADQGTIEDADGLPATFPDDYTFQWVRVDANGMSNPADVGTDSATYTPVTADGGKKILVTVGFTDDGGTDEELTSEAYPASGTVTEPNTVPTGADTTVTTPEDVAYAFAAAEFGFSDADSGDTLASVTVVTLPSVGELALDGAAVTEDQAIAVADIGKLAFTPAPNGNGTDYAGFTFRVSDGTDESLSAYTMTVNVTPVQDAPAGAPAISGTAVVGGSLTADQGTIEDADGLPATFPDDYTFQWVRVDADGMSNPADVGTDSATYTPVTADGGKKILVTVGFTDDGGTDEELTSEAYPASGTVTVGVGICERTEEVRDAIVNKVGGVNNCAYVTPNNLAAITGTLILDSQSITALAAGDFNGLTALTKLYLSNNALSTLPAGVFDALAERKRCERPIFLTPRMRG